MSFKKWFFFFSLCLCASVVKSGFGTAAPLVIEVTGSAVPTRYIRDKTTAQIAAMHPRQLRGQHVPGITFTRIAPKFQLRVNLRKVGRNKVLVWVEELKVQFDLSIMDVCISSRYPEGSCEYGVILNHENLHVGYNLGSYRKYLANLERELRRTVSIPTGNHPLSARSFEGGKNIIATRITRFLEGYQKRCIREAGLSNARIDTPASYRRAWAPCHGK